MDARDPAPAARGDGASRDGGASRRGGGASASAPGRGWRAVALPPEHGSWGLVGEPVVLGLLVAPGWAPFLVGLAAFAAFLAYRPAKLAWGDLRRGRRYPRTAVALRLASGFGAAAVLSLAGALGLTGSLTAGAGARWLLPFLLAAPIGLLFVVYDLLPGRSWQAEVAAPAAFASTVAAMALAAGVALPVGLALWGVMAARSVPSVLYVRERLRLERGEPPRRLLALGAHGAGLAGVLALVAAGWLPILAALAVGLLLVRAGWGLSHLRRPSPPRAVGFAEIAWGAVTVLLVASGFWTGSSAHSRAESSAHPLAERWAEHGADHDAEFRVGP